MPTAVPPVTPASSSAAQTVAPGSVTPVEASVGNAPDKIQQLAHQIQVSGLITQPPDGNSVTLNTVLGNLTILLPLLAKDQQDKLIQQLTALFQGQKPLTVVVQPGDPPTQAFLLLPPAATTIAPPTTAVPANALLQTMTPLPPPLAPGAVLPAVVLPTNTLVTGNPASPVQPNTQVLPSSSSTPALQAPLQAPLQISVSPVAGAPLMTAPTDEQITILTDLTLLDELASKAEELMRQVLPEMQAKLFAGTSLPQDISQAPLPSFVAAPATPAPAVNLLPNQPSTTVSTPVSAPIPLQAPAETISSPVVTVAAETATPALPSAPVVTPVIPTPLASLLQPGAEVSLRVDAVALPAAPLPVLSAPNQILATVTGSGPNGQLLVQAGNTALYVKQGVNVPVGSTLLITVEPARPPPLMPLPLPDTNNFGQLQQALTALAQIDPQLARQVMESMIPQPNAALGGALMFILSAFGQGNLRGWLGNNAVDALSKAGKMELIARLTEQLSEGGQVVHDPVVGAWRSYTVPLHTDNQFQTLHFYVHGDGRGSSGKKQKDSKPGAGVIRFLIDMRLSRLGAMQLDGFVRQKQLDMIVRSEKILPEGLNENLRLTYIKALEAVGYAGTLNFQTGRQYWLNLRKASGSMVM